MSDSTTSQIITRSLCPLVGIACFLAIFFLTFTMFSNSRSPSINDSIGRYQMHISNDGTIIIMDTVAGVISQVDQIDNLRPKRK